MSWSGCRLFAKLVRGFNAGEGPVKGLLNDGPTSLFAARLADPQFAQFGAGLKTRVGAKGAGARFADGRCLMQRRALKRLLWRDARTHLVCRCWRGVSAESARQCRLCGNRMCQEH